MRTEKMIAAGVLPICKETGRLLLIRRGQKQSQAGTWASFGGKFESGEDKNPKENALREFVEESGYGGKFKISNKPLDVYNTNHLIFYTFVGMFDNEFVPDLEQGEEASDYGWFELENLPSDLHPGVFEMFEKNKKTISKIINFFKKQNN